MSGNIQYRTQYDSITEYSMFYRNDITETG